MKTFESPIEQLLMYEMYVNRQYWINPDIYRRYNELNTFCYSDTRNCGKKRVLGKNKRK